MSGIGIDVVPNLPKFPMPGRTGGIYRRYASVCTAPETPFGKLCTPVAQHPGYGYALVKIPGYEYG